MVRYETFSFNSSQNLSDGDLTGFMALKITYLMYVWACGCVKYIFEAGFWKNILAALEKQTSITVWKKPFWNPLRQAHSLVTRTHSTSASLPIAIGMLSRRSVQCSQQLKLGAGELRRPRQASSQVCLSCNAFIAISKNQTSPYQDFALFRQHAFEGRGCLFLHHVANRVR